MNDQPSEDTVTLAIKKSTLNAAFVVLVSFASGFGAAWFIFSRNTPTLPQTQLQTSLQEAADVQLELEGRPYLGPENAPVTIVEFTDYECPFCGRHFRETLPVLVREYEGSVKYVVLNFPISQIHPFAQQAAEAAECAHDQGKFWEYHDTLFDNQAALDVRSLKNYAIELGLDAELFNDCLDSGEKAQRVLADLEDGLVSGVTGTPAFVINGQLLVGAWPFDRFQTLIDAALNE